jgi:hypothetical protein
MPSAERLIRLYPPAWRKRYGAEFLAMLGTDRLGAPHTFDIVMAAIDAWLSADVRNATREGHLVASGGRTMTLQSLMACGRAQRGVTPRDGLFGAGVMLGVTAVMSVLGIVARRNGKALPLGAVELSSPRIPPILR